MNIGQRINKFDNTVGTVKEFNKLFPESPLKGSQELQVEVLNVPLGKPFHRTIAVNGKLLDHNFFPKKVYNYNKRKDDGIKKPKFRYTVKKNGEVIDTVYQASDLKKYFRQSVTNINRNLRIYKIVEQDSLSVTRARYGEAKYYIVHDTKGNEKKLGTLGEVVKYIGIKCYSTISKQLKNNGTYKSRTGYTVEQKEIK